MKRPRFGIGVLRPLLLGMLLGGLFTALGFFPQGLSIRNWHQELKQGFSLRLARAETPWPPPEFYSPCDWSYLRVDELAGWSTGSVGSFEALDKRLGRLEPNVQELLIPILPTVFTPMMFDKLYYDALLESDIERGDKVLVIGTGSGADAWVAWLKSQAPVYVVDINPMAIVNAKTTARLGNFEIKAVVGDIREVNLPDSFRDFDFVLWNMPFLEASNLAERKFHDGDDGSILESFLALLPSLLKKDGKAIVLNVDAAEEFINSPGVTTKTNGKVMLFAIPNRES